MTDEEKKSENIRQEINQRYKTGRVLFLVYVGLEVLFVLVGFVYDMIRAVQRTQPAADIVSGIAWLIVGAGITLLIAFLLYRGYNGARIFLIVINMISIALYIAGAIVLEMTLRSAGMNPVADDAMMREASRASFISGVLIIPSFILLLLPPFQFFMEKQRERFGG